MPSSQASDLVVVRTYTRDGQSPATGVAARTVAVAMSAAAASVPGATQWGAPLRYVVSPRAADVEYSIYESAPCSAAAPRRLARSSSIAGARRRRAAIAHTTYLHVTHNPAIV